MVLSKFEEDGLPASIQAADVIEEFDSFALMMYLAQSNLILIIKQQLKGGQNIQKEDKITILVIIRLSNKLYYKIQNNWEKN